MDSYSFWLYAHVLLFVYWLGADLGVFTLALALRNRRYTCEQRRLLMRLSLTIDMVPRFAMAMIAPVGLVLAMRLGLVAVPTWFAVIVWTAALLWFVGECVAFRRMGEPVAIRIYIAIGVLFVVCFVGLTAAGAWSLRTGHPIGAGWLSLKVLLSGLVFFVSIMMARYYAPLQGVFERMAAEGSSDELEQQVRGYVNKGAFFTVLLFVMLATIGFLGSAKPF